uniref:Uncharacterized protein n=1 Tax=Pavo cristatus TaxID=9049 RepID=A0A8C9FJG5_PAVCR
MLTSRTFLKRTRAGAVVKVVREHYLRDDIPCGADACPLCPVRPGQPLGLEARPSGAASSLCPGPHYLLPDTNLLLHQVSASRPRLSVRCDLSACRRSEELSLLPSPAWFKPLGPRTIPQL